MTFHFVITPADIVGIVICSILGSFILFFIAYFQYLRWQDRRWLAKRKKENKDTII